MEAIWFLDTQLVSPISMVLLNSAIDFANISAWVRQYFEWDLGAAIAAVGLLTLVTLLAQRPRFSRVKFSWLLLAFVPLLWLVRLLFDKEKESAVWWALYLPTLFLLLVVLGRALLLLVSLGLVERLGRKLPRIAMDLLNLGVAIAALLLTLNVAGVNPAALFAGSAVLTAVLGLALKDTLGNLFSGLALQAQRPFEIGDWIQYDDKSEHIGQVMEINWRATKVLTLDLAEVIVPNGILTEACIRNFSKPDRIARRSVTVSASYSSPPHEVHRVILRALEGCAGVLSSPSPSVITQGFGDSGVNYWIRFYVKDFSQRDLIEGKVRERIWYAFARAEISIPFPIRDVRLTPMPEIVRRTLEEDLIRRGELLGRIEVLAVLPPAALAQLSTVAKEETFGNGELIIQQGDVSDRLFLLIRGKAIVYAKSGETLLGVEVGRLSEGKVFGEMSLFTGAPRAASVMADGECQVLSVDKAAMAPVLRDHPDLVERIGEVLASHKALLESKLDAAATLTPPVEKRRALVRLIQSFFASEKIE